MTSPLRADKYTWLITNDMDTNLADSECTYDRIIITESAKEDHADKAGVDRFDVANNLTPEKAKKVSDHYPVWAAFYVNKDTD